MSDIVAPRGVVERRSVLTCPACGHAEAIEMPTDACVFFHACTGCGVMLRPKKNDCCVFCSYGSIACPPVQADPAARACCGDGG